MLYVSMALQSLIFPFQWKHNWIPYVVNDIRELVGAPMTYIFCIDKALLPENIQIPSETTRVHLDEGDVWLEEENLKMPSNFMK